MSADFDNLLARANTVGAVLTGYHEDATTGDIYEVRTQDVDAIARQHHEMQWTGVDGYFADRELLLAYDVPTVIVEQWVTEAFPHNPGGAMRRLLAGELDDWFLRRAKDPENRLWKIFPGNI